ncbi:S-(hydroxymethyl)mycothiol dehydrogenase [Kineococcus glutinatus]|uniref:S-(Hydroxymethyl)mycothiol dehydrogenase n=1 Tax=Kineococcus glutinatus TaxID=1070872 RepID=A0ABP9HUK8_9ACTN
MTGVVSRAKGAPVELVEIVVPDPGPGEVVVDVAACGVCHTDLHYREGGINDEFPFLLGHEAAGTVAAVGEGVSTHAVGDRVVLNWRAVCGRCRACRRGEPQYCFATHNASRPMTLADGTPLSPALGIGAFAAKTLVAAGQATIIDTDALGGWWDPAVAGLLGCGVMAGLGAAVNTAPVRRGDTVAVIGCGGVGCAAIAGAVLAGARRVVAVDVDAGKLAWAQRLGASHTVDSSRLDEDGVVAAVQALTDGVGADVVIDAVGRPETWRQAFYARDLAGTVVLVGVPTPEMQLSVPLLDVFGRGGALKSSWYGDCLPERDFPALLELHTRGRLPLDAFVTERIALEEVEAAFATMARGDVLRSVVVLDGSGAGATS